MLGKQLQTAAAGNAGGEVLGVEDVFSTWLYESGGNESITNGIDLSTNGGLVWIKDRLNINNNCLVDTNRGINNYISSNTTTTQQSISTVTAFNSDGFSIGGNALVSGGGRAFASWTFRKAEKFFDVVTYTGTGSPRTVAHNLGSVPGVIIVKAYDYATSWIVHHRSLGASQVLELEGTNAAATRNDFNSTLPTASVFSVSNSNNTNRNGTNYVAYLFAHDAGGFGDDGTESVIKCGSYTGNGSDNGPTIDLGWEPQFVIIKRTNDVGNWLMLDAMRGISDTSTPFLYSNLSSAEASASPGWMALNPTGFTIKYGGNTNINGSGSTYIYIAIRRGPMKTPTDATEVFSVDSQLGSGVVFRPGFVTDFGVKLFTGGVSSTYAQMALARLTGDGFLATSQTNAESTALSNAGNWDNMIGWGDLSGTGYGLSFKRAPGFFDVVAYTGTGSATTVSHNLGVAPELMIVKCRENTGQWAVWHTIFSGSDDWIRLNLNNAAGANSTIWDSTAPTSTVFTVGSSSSTNASGLNHIAYLFATCPGVSKVGSYTGTGTTLSIDCGFSAGARFVLIKRTDSTGDWYVWDTARGIVSGNDPYLLLNSTAAEDTSTDYIDPLSTGFQISSSAPAAINALNGEYIFLAIA